MALREDQLAIEADLEDAAARANQFGASVGAFLPDPGLQLEGARLVAS